MAVLKGGGSARSTLSLAASVLAAGCRVGAHSAPLTPRGPAAPTRELSASTPPPAAPAAPVAPVAPPPLGPDALCRATLRRAERLRPEETFSDAGPALAAGSALEVLDASLQGHDEVGLFRVRVAGTGALGYTLLAPGELDARCPVAWSPLSAEALREAERTLAPTPLYADRAHALAARARRRDDVVSPQLLESVTTTFTADLDGDGHLDEYLVWTYRSDFISTAAGALLRRGRRWALVGLGSESAFDHNSFSEGSSYDVLLLEGGGAYFVRRGWESTLDEPPPVHSAARYNLQRCHPGGACPFVFEASTAFGPGETWAFEGAEGGSLRVVSGERAQRLRWDPAAWRLVAE